jgi:flagellar L-ring protein precursor FlgH
MTMLRKICLMATTLVALGACSALPTGTRPGDYPSAPAPLFTPAAAKSGTIYQSARGLSLFEDIKARQVGDTVTIRLAESTQASKSASTDAKKDSTINTGTPKLLDGLITEDGAQSLLTEWTTAQQFGGKGSSSQSNSLNGNITVTVAEVYPNGNLLVRGEKWLTLNQGEEYVQIAGIVRPSDIGPDNSVASFKVADARITYSGTGAVADSNRPGILTRFFLKLWPF